jgi:L-ribulokinase
MPYAIGFDYGTNSVRCLIVDTANGRELGTCIYEYETGQAGIILDSRDHNVARQNLADYLKGIEVTVSGAIAEAKKAEPKFNPKDIVGIGVDTTGSTPLPVDSNGTPLAILDAFKDNPNAHVWLWKDHTGYAEAAEITALAQKKHPEYLAKCGGTYSSEWFFSKVLHCLRTAPKVYDAAYTWVEHVGWIPAVLTGTDQQDKIKRYCCAAGHKLCSIKNGAVTLMLHFSRYLTTKPGNLRKTLGNKTFAIDRATGKLTEQWVQKLGLNPGFLVAIVAFDAHFNAICSGIRQRLLVKIIGNNNSFCETIQK